MSGEAELKRFTVSISEEDAERLRVLAENHRPPLSQSYVVRYAVRMLLDRAEDPQLSFQLGDPLTDEATDER